MGYKIDRIHQVWHFEESSFDLFKTYIESFFATSRKPLAIPPDVTLQKNNRRTLTIIFRTKV